ncbi:unnamed protein product [Bursaphelenchus xylophilus]|uniref:(pine wood nematode) hypothetical protein n=1 Tax=Bursaphelenchus xylophilus TaxID=6326 RepID=A0A1I7RVD5_BURXY|nr:unnamed protein product [Bursaphelenchus xylophilus]CAG9086704.1 unnamed protein product [Bursaphelenchus xylophilus]
MEHKQTGTGSDPVLKLFDRTCDSILMGRPNSDDVKKLLVIFLEDCRKLSTYLAREQRARSIAESQTAVATGNAQKELKNLWKAVYSLDTMDLGLEMWSSVINKDVKDLKAQSADVKKLSDAQEASKKVLLSLSKQVDQCLASEDDRRAQIAKLEEGLAGVRALYIEQARALRELRKDMEAFAEAIETSKRNGNSSDTALDPGGGHGPAPSAPGGRDVNGDEHVDQQLGDQPRPSYDWDDIPNELAGGSVNVQADDQTPAVEEEEQPIITSLECNSLLKPFDPNGNMTFPEWLEKFEDFRDQQSTPWANDVAVKKLRMFLSGEPRERLIKIASAATAGEGGNTFKDFEQIKKELLESFKQDGGQAIARAELTVMRQQHDEPVNAFIQRLKRLVARLDPDLPAPIREKRVFEEFMSRVRDDIATPLRLSVPENFEQAKAKALAIESINASSRLLARDSMANGFATMVQSLAGVNVNGDKGNSKKGSCFYCGIEGHFARECRKKARDRRHGRAPYYESNGNLRRQGDFWRPSNRNESSTWRSNGQDEPARRSINLVTVQESVKQEDPVVAKTEREKAMELLKRKHENLLKRHTGSSIYSLHPMNIVPSVVLLVTCISVLSPSAEAIQPMICQHKFGRRLVGLPEPPDCPQIDVRPKVRPTSLLLDIYRENEDLSSTPAEVCQIFI